MLGEILDGHFILEPSNNSDEDMGIQIPNYAFAIVCVQMEDNCWYNVQLQKIAEDSDWSIGYDDIRPDAAGTSGHFKMPYENREQLVERILNYNKFRLPFLFL